MFQPFPQIYPDNFVGPHGFPVWVRYCHFFNFLFVMMLIRSGLSILMDHPRLYFNDGCTPGSEWIRLTPLKVPRECICTAKDDARYISPIDDQSLSNKQEHGHFDDCLRRRIESVVLGGFRIMGCALFISFGIVPAAHVQSQAVSLTRSPRAWLVLVQGCFICQYGIDNSPRSFHRVFTDE